MISAWSMFRDDDLPVRPNGTDTRNRSFHEHMVHQCVSEDIWFRTMLDIDVGAPPLPKEEVRLEFMRQYEEDSGRQVPDAYVFTAFGNSAIISMSPCKQDLTHHSTCSARSKMLRARCWQGLFRIRRLKADGV